MNHLHSARSSVDLGSASPRVLHLVAEAEGGYQAFPSLSGAQAGLVTGHFVACE